ncbi:uncharacterized protein V1518DRAFT_419206 [Limtongia smithiae]|uniref:uncharacterized protein n=1 Tax=Limtongia smithiae TaxID=1125753 RepID=UPI0034CFF237
MQIWSATRRAPAGDARAPPTRQQVAPVSASLSGISPASPPTPPPDAILARLLGPVDDLPAPALPGAPTSKPLPPSAAYSASAAKLRELHLAVASSDGVLATVQTDLSRFVADLGLLSQEMEALQTRSLALQRRLAHRAAAEQRLAALVHDVVVPPALVQLLVVGEIDARYIRAVQLLASRLHRVAQFRAALALDATADHVRLVADVAPVLTLLADKAVERIRDLIARHIRALRTPNANAQAVQAVLLRFRALYAFLAHANGPLARDLTKAYVLSMRWYYSAHFARYARSLALVPVRYADRRALLAAAAEQDAQHAAIELGARAAVALAPDTPVLLQAAAERQASAAAAAAAENSTASTGALPLEMVMRSLNVVLVDNACAEYLFIANFFAHAGADAHAQLFHEIYSPALALGDTQATQLLDTAGNDALGVLVAVRVVHALGRTLQRRCVPVLDGYLDRINMLLWPRFQAVMDANAESLRKLIPVRPAGSTSAAAAVVAFLRTEPGPTPAAARTQALAVTTAFSTFAHSILALCTDPDAASEPVAGSLTRVAVAYEAYIARAATRAAPSDERAQAEFVSTCCARVVSVLADSQGVLAEQQRARFENSAVSKLPL